MQTLMILTTYILGVREKKEVIFCDCHSDPVRLIKMGYIGSSPVFPQTAFSIRLLRMHHVVWKHCAIATQPFALALDEILDGFNPPMISPDTHQVSLESMTRYMKKTKLKL